MKISSTGRVSIQRVMTGMSLTAELTNNRQAGRISAAGECHKLKYNVGVVTLSLPTFSNSPWIRGGVG